MTVTTDATEVEDFELEAFEVVDVLEELDEDVLLRNAASGVGGELA